MATAPLGTMTRVWLSSYQHESVIIAKSSSNVNKRKYRVKGQVTPGGVLELLFTSDGGETFYNADNVRWALNAAN